MSAAFTKECTDCYFVTPEATHVPAFTKKKIQNISHFQQRIFTSQERFQEDQIMSGLLTIQNSFENKRKDEKGVKKVEKSCWKDKVNRKREFIKRCIRNQAVLNLAEVAKFTRSCPKTVKRIYNELCLSGEVSFYKYNNLKSEQEESALDKSIDRIEEGFQTITDLKREHSAFSRKAILKRLHQRGFRYRLLPKERRNPEIRIISSTRICRVISHIAQAIADQETTILYIDEMKFPLFQTSARRWAHKDVLPRDNFVYNRRPAHDVSTIVAIALCSTEKFEAVQLYNRDVNGLDFLHFLNEAISHLPPHKHYTIIADNAGWHLASVVNKSKANKFLYFNEPKMFQLNLIENAFSFIRHEFRKRPIVHSAVEEAKEIVRIFFDEKNKERFKGVFRNHLRMLIKFLDKHKPK